MIQLRHIALSIASAVAVVALSGCAGDVDGDAEQSASLSTSTSPQTFPLFGGGGGGGWGSATPVCPPASTPPAPYQAVATRVAHYVLGGADPFMPSPIYNGPVPSVPLSTPACNEARVCSNILRANIESGNIMVGSPVADVVCGIPASTFTLTLQGGIPAPDRNALAQCAVKMDACWGTGVSGFFYPQAINGTNVIKIDPEPARQTAALTGSTGATAAAVYENSGTPTTTIMWGTAYTTPSFTLVAGTPCANGYVPVGDTTKKVIQALGPGRRCY